MLHINAFSDRYGSDYWKMSMENHYNEVIMSAIASQTPAPRFIQAQIIENIKAPRHWPLWRDFTGDRWIPLTKASNAENVSIWWRHNMIQLGGNENLVSLVLSRTRTRMILSVLFRRFKTEDQIHFVLYNKSSKLCPLSLLGYISFRYDNLTIYWRATSLALSVRGSV